MEHELISELISMIKEEEALMREFLELLETQKTLLVQNKAEEFELTVSNQEELIQKIRDQEQKRIEKISEISRGMKVNEDEITITRLVEMSLGQVSTELNTAKKNMTNLVDRIRRANSVNEYLIKRSLNLAQRSIDLLIDENYRDVIYSKDGTLSGQERKSILINKTL